MRWTIRGRPWDQLLQLTELVSHAVEFIADSPFSHPPRLVDTYPEPTAERPADEATGRLVRPPPP